MAHASLTLEIILDRSAASEAFLGERPYVSLAEEASNRDQDHANLSAPQSTVIAQHTTF